MSEPLADTVPPSVTLQPFQPSHLELLAVWLRQPHVARWFPEPERNLAWAMNPPTGGSQAILAEGRQKSGMFAGSMSARAWARPPSWPSPPRFAKTPVSR
jgi:hypothetical protein